MPHIARLNKQEADDSTSLRSVDSLDFSAGFHRSPRTGGGFSAHKQKQQTEGQAKAAKLNLLRVPVFSKETAYKSPPSKLFPGGGIEGFE